MGDECVSPGTMWASVMMPESNGMSKLHVCVGMIFVPFGSMILIEYVASCMFTAVNPSTQKCPVAPESKKANSTAFCNLIVLKMVCVIWSLNRMLNCTMCCYAAERVVVCSGCAKIWLALMMVPRVPLL